MPASRDPITGPRDTTQNTFQAHDAISHITGAHSFRRGVDFRRNQINMTRGIASNGFFVSRRFRSAIRSQVFCSVSRGVFQAAAT